MVEQSNEKEWVLPEAIPFRPVSNGLLVRFTRGELLLLDWVLCTGSSLMQRPVDELIKEWHDFRVALWIAIGDKSHDEQEFGVLIPITESEAKVLLTTVPTTMTWGDGADVGVSVKTKLSQLLVGRYKDAFLLEQETKREKERDEAKQLAVDKLRATQRALSTATERHNELGVTLKTRMTEARRTYRENQTRANKEAEKVTKALQQAEAEYLEAAEEARQHGIDPNQNPSDSEAYG